MHPPEAIWARDFVETVRRGDVDQMSFGFKVVKDKFTGEDDRVLRELVEVISLMSRPPLSPPTPRRSSRCAPSWRRLGFLLTSLRAF
ncbi:MAG: HK97 family phage prohead protease [Candidatus Tectimicrobiota bacterium]